MIPQRYEGLDALRVFSSFGVVFIHVYMWFDQTSLLNFFSKFRDFALPFMVMSSFFLLTLSLKRKRDRNFGIFFNQRLKRLWVPFIIWTFIYSVLVAVVLPILFGKGVTGEIPSPVVLLTGYRHLWYLQFIFISSLISYPLICRLIEKKQQTQLKLSFFCFCLSLLYGFLFYSFLKNYTAWDRFSAETDINLKIFVSQAGNYILYIPIAIGAGLASDKINTLFAQAAFRFAFLSIAFITMILHVKSEGVPFTREIYGIAVFLAALQPWRRIPLNIVQVLASYSYGVYILHFLFAQILWLYVADKNLELGGSTILAISLIIYFISLSAAVLIRKLFPADWFLPMVPVGAKHGRQSVKNIVLPFGYKDTKSDSLFRV